MSFKSLLSSTEQKLLSTFALLICGLYFTNLADKAVASYNRSVRAAEAAQANIANGFEQISFGFSCHYVTPIYETLLVFQFLFIPLIYYWLSLRRTGGFVFSTLLTALTLSGYCGWLYRTFSAIKFDRSYDLAHTSLHGFLFFNSTSPEFVLFLALSALFILQISILIRFALIEFDRNNKLS